MYIYKAGDIIIYISVRVFLFYKCLFVPCFTEGVENKQCEVNHYVHLKKHKIQRSDGQRPFNPISSPF